MRLSKIQRESLEIIEDVFPGTLIWDANKKVARPLANMKRTHKQAKQDASAGRCLAHAPIKQNPEKSITIFEAKSQ